MRTLTGLLMLALVAGLSAGCANYTQPAGQQPQQTLAQQNFETMWSGSLEVLRKYNFNVDRQDRRAGLITTHPMIGQQWFEFWRKDAVTRRDVAEGSLQEIYRIATIRIQPCSDGSSQYAANVEVMTERSDRTDREIDSVTQVYRMFILSGNTRDRHEMLLERRTGDDPKAVIAPLGRDKELEAKIAADIAKQTANRQVVAK
jgi:hypothetical protein